MIVLLEDDLRGRRDNDSEHHSGSSYRTHYPSREGEKSYARTHYTILIRQRLIASLKLVNQLHTDLTNTRRVEHPFTQVGENALYFFSPFLLQITFFFLSSYFSEMCVRSEHVRYILDQKKRLSLFFFRPRHVEKSSRNMTIRLFLCK